jgi:hypothetical protein
MENYQKLEKVGEGKKYRAALAVNVYGKEQ